MRLDPNFPPALNNLGVLLLKVERYDEAAHWLEQLLERNPDTPAALVNLGRARIGQQRPVESHSYFQRATALDPENVNTYEVLGVSQRDLGLHAEAEATFRAGLRREPENANILYNLTYTLVDQSHTDEAFETANHNVIVNPDSALAQMAIGHLYCIHNKPQQGLPHLRRAIELEPDNLGVRMNYGKALEAIWKPEEALAAYVHVIARDARFDDALARCIDATVSLGQWDQFDHLLSTLINVIEEEAASDELPKVLAFNLQALPISYELIAQSARQASRAVIRDEGVDTPRFNYGPHSSSDVLRVGYLLPYTWWHRSYNRILTGR